MRASLRRPAGEGVAASIDTSGQPAARGAAVDALRTQGTYVEVGVGHDPTIAPQPADHFPGSDLARILLNKQHEWEGLVDFVRRREVPIKSLITHRFRPKTPSRRSSWPTAPRPERSCSTGVRTGPLDVAVT